ncbi:MAG: type II toxin-antitoxin system death-on-curing family toxin [Treponema sp.]
MKKIIELSIDQILKLHSSFIGYTGGFDGVRDINLIESAINNPFQIFGGVDLYPSLEEKASRLCYNLAMNHGFLD